ncbi:MAG: hypothetical protein MJ078_08980, partial [Clostridia bacterium]|nr:hypothetical protein [Clostridia bacterium]
MSKPIVPVNCFFQGCYNPEYEKEIGKCKKKCFRYNQICPTERAELDALLREIVGSVGKEVYVTPPSKNRKAKYKRRLFYETADK